MSFFAKFKKGNDLCPVAASLYGTCATAAGTAEKAVTLPECDVLVPGMSLSVKFTNSNTAANPTLNVNSLGAVPIYRYGITAAGNTVNTSWPAGAVVQFTYGISSGSDYGFYMTSSTGITDMSSTIRDIVYPVGSIYMSINSTSPATIIGGSWERIQDRFLLSAGETYTAGATGGSADAVVPAHSHAIAANETESRYISHTHKANFGTASNYAFLQSANPGTVISRQSAVKWTSSSQGDSLSVPAYASGDTPVFQIKPTTGYPVTSQSGEDTTTHTHDIAAHTTESAGTSATGANLPPYLAVYMWKRVS